jgi:hypothetical protein
VSLYTHNSVWRRISTAPLSLHFDTRWRWVLSFTPWLLYPWENKFQHRSDRRLAGPQNWPGNFEEVSFIPRALCRWEKSPLGTQWICGCVGHGAGVDLRIQEKPLAPAGNQTLVHQTDSLVTTLTELQSRTLPVSMLNTMKADRAGKHYFIYMCKLNTHSNEKTADKNRETA